LVLVAHELVDDSQPFPAFGYLLFKFCHMFETSCILPNAWIFCAMSNKLFCQTFRSILDASVIISLTVTKSV